MDHPWRHIPDPDAAAYVHRAQVARDESLALIAFITGYFFHAACFAYEQIYVYEGSHRLIFGAMHFTLCCAHTIWLTLLRPRGVPGRHLMFVLQVVLTGTFVYLV